MSQVCKNCSAVLSANDKFCIECGTPVPKPSVPTCVCGTVFIPNAKFCMKCGATNPIFKADNSTVNQNNTSAQQSFQQTQNYQVPPQQNFQQPPPQNFQQPPQQNYYAPPPQQPVKPKKKSGSGCLIAILVLVFLFIAGSVIIYFFVIKPNWQEFGFDELFAKNKTEIQLNQKYG